MKQQKQDKTNVMRLLDAAGIAYRVQEYGDKKVEMLPMKELLPTTGYIRGGCSPIGMKKKFPTYIEETAVLFDEIAVSAGIRGAQVILNPEDLKAYTEAEYASLTIE